MQMILKSIAKIKRVYDTGQNPVLVSCDDMEEYVCKHSRGGKPSYVLFAEWLVYQMMVSLDVELAPVSFVKVEGFHIESVSNCQPLFFSQTTCFATRYLAYAEEWNQLTTSKNDLKRIVNKDDLLIISFIDIWFSNEDRNWNNFNLLMYPSIEGVKVIPIDHGNCLNTLGFNEERPLYQIDYNDSVISTELFISAMKGYFKNIEEVNVFVEKLYLRIRNLDKVYDDIVEKAPSDWQIPISYIHALKQNLFHNDWLSDVKSSFLSFVKTSIKLK
jgi:hypothetical protein